ncbi:MAG: MBL fold metallo-hydrolase, partial [Armatimonadota bacterium]
MREPDEVQAWPFLGSTHIPLQEVLNGRLEGLPGDREIIALCAHGNRSQTAAQELRRRGMTARSLRGGIAAWSQVYDPATIPLPGDAAIVQLRRLGKGCLSYLVAAGGEAAVIDPSWHIERYVQTAAAMGATIRHVIDTHLHADHISGARQLAQATRAFLHLNPVERFGFDRFEPSQEGDVVRIGSSRLSALAAPGHTAGSLVWSVEGHALLTGDVLFLENIGRPDLHGHAEAYARDLYRTLKRLAALGDDRLILPGHMPET